MPPSILHPPSALEINVVNRQRVKTINVRWLRQITQAALAELNVETAELGITLLSARAMAQLNWRYLQHEGATDVITFDHSIAEVGARKADRRLHGELFICVDVAVAQANVFHTCWQAEVVRYVVHGILHLLGYDDTKPALRRTMKRAENRLVRRLAAAFALAKLSPPIRMVR